MKVVVRADASLQIGTGHVMRCLTLAHELKKQGAEIEFICREHKGHIISLIHKQGYKVYSLPCRSVPKEQSEKEVDSVFTVQQKYHFNNEETIFHAGWLGATQLQDAEQCRPILEKVQPDWLIVDHYAIGRTWQLALQGAYKKCMVIDDIGDRHHRCDLLLDQNYGSTKEKYQALVPENCKILNGPRYALLRPEFALWRSYSLQRREVPQLKKLLVTLGGVDQDNYTGKVLGQLEQCKLPDEFEIIIVMGETAPHLKTIKAQAESMPNKTVVKVNVNNMAEVMANADLAIGAAGGTTWERCCLGLPTIQMVIADNQKKIVCSLATEKVIKLLKGIEKLPDLIKTASNWMRQTSYIAADICDGLGVQRVVELMIEGRKYKYITLEEYGGFFMKNYIDLRSEEKKPVLAMRNHPEIRKWMYNKKRISLTEHLAFIEALKYSLTKDYLLVMRNEELIGSINFTDINYKKGVAKFGVFANPFAPTKHVGTILEALSYKYAKGALGLEYLELEVFKINERAVNLYQKVGYNLVNEIKVNGRDVICMKKKLN